MFRAITFVFSTLLVGLGALIYIQWIQPQDSDTQRYQQLMGSLSVKHPPKLLEQTPTQQLRTYVQKDFWIENRHVRLKSPHSDLWIKPQGNKKFEITECFESLECCLQEPQTDETQEIRWLSAQQSTFTYPTNQFTAQDVTVSLFSLPNTEFPDTKPQTSPYGSVTADSALWDWPNPLYLQGNVHLFSAKFQERETYALADALVFHPSSNKLILQAQEGKKVLLWQDDRHLSAPAFEIEKDHKSESVKGLGDVHFYFSGEEEDLLHKIFPEKTH